MNPIAVQHFLIFKILGIIFRSTFGIISRRIIGIIISNRYIGRSFFSIIVKEVNLFIFFESKRDTTEFVNQRSLHRLPKILFITVPTVVIIYD